MQVTDGSGDLECDVVIIGSGPVEAAVNTGLSGEVFEVVG